MVVSRARLAVSGARCPWRAPVCVFCVVGLVSCSQCLVLGARVVRPDLFLCGGFSVLFAVSGAGWPCRAPGSVLVWWV